MVIFLKWFLFFMGCSSAFAISAWLRLPNILVIIMCCMSLIPFAYNGKVLKDKAIMPIFLFMIGMIISITINYNENSVNYLVSYGFFWCVYYFLLTNVFLMVDSEAILRWIFFGVLFTMLFVVLNWISSFSGISLQEIIPRINETGATFSGVSRAYGFSTEPGILAFYLNSFMPVCYYYLSSRVAFQKKIITYLFISLYIFCLILTGSASGFAVLAMFVTVLLLIGLKNALINNKYLEIVVLLTLFGLISMVILFLVKNYAPFILDSVVGKFTLNQNSTSVSSRLDKVEAAKQIFDSSSLLWGAGPGYHSSVGLPGAGNWFLMILLETGLVGLVSIFYFMAIIFFRIIRLKGLLSKCLLLSFLATVCHLSLISTFFHPYFFIVAALSTTLYSQRQRAITVD